MKHTMKHVVYTKTRTHLYTHPRYGSLLCLHHHHNQCEYTEEYATEIGQHIQCVMNMTAYSIRVGKCAMKQALWVPPEAAILLDVTWKILPLEYAQQSAYLRYIYVAMIESIQDQTIHVYYEE